MAGERAFYRNRVANVFPWLVTVVLMVLIGFAVAHDLGRSSPSAVEAGIGAVVLVLVAIPAVRLPRRGVCTTSIDVVIRTLLHTHVVRWEDIDRFVVSTPVAFGRYGVVVLRDGRRLRITGVASGLGDQYAEHAVATLNLQLEEHTHGRAGGGVPV